MKQYRISEISQHTENVKVLRLKSLDGDNINFSSGQYIDVSIANNAHKNDVDYTSFSITSLPSNKQYLEIAVLASGTYRQKIFDASIGTQLNINGPYGDFIYKHHTQLLPVFIVGGSGIAPIMSMLRYISHKFPATECTLFYTCKSKNNIIFFDELNSLSMKNTMLKCHIVITCEKQYNKFNGTGIPKSLYKDKRFSQGRLYLEHGRIDETMIVNRIKDIESKIFYLCGPYEMVIMLRFILQKQGVVKNCIKAELWS